MLPRALAAALLAGGAGLLLTRGASGGIVSIGFSACVVVLGVLLDPEIDRVRSAEPGGRADARRALEWAGVLGGVAGGLVLLSGGGLELASHLAVGVAVLSFALAALTRLLVRVTGEPGRPRLWIVAGLALCAAAPIWLGPLAERLGAAPGLVDSVIAVSPLSYLAVLAETDYLRVQWFYSHSPLGSLPFDYPGWVASTGSWILLGSLLLAGSCVANRSANRTRDRRTKA